MPNNEEENVTKPGMHHILVPAGKCPFQFSTEEEIETWVNKIKAFGANKGQTYDPGALVYWAGTFIDKFSNKGRELIDKLKTFLA